jgi:hypothetical protein
MKYIKKLNIDFDNWSDILMDTNEQQIKELHPVFYKFLKEKNLLGIYLEMFDKCRWKDNGDTFEKIMNNHKVKRIFLLNPFDRTLNYQCIYKKNVKYYELVLKFSSEFKKFFFDKYI